MSELNRILKLAGQAEQEAQSPAVDREMKAVEEAAGVCEDCGCEIANPTEGCECTTHAHHIQSDVEEAVGDSAESIWALCDQLECADHPVFNELVRYLDGDTLQDFVADFKRHNEMHADMEEAAPSAEDREKSIRRAFAHDDERGEEKKKVSVKKAPWEESVNEAGGYYTQPVYDMIEKHGIEKVMHELLTALDADVIQDAMSRMGEGLVKEASKPDFADIDGDGDKDEDMKKAAKDKDELDEAQSPAQKAAFAKMLASKGGKKDDDDEDDDKEELEESPTMDTTQLITLMKNSGLSEEAIQTKLTEWANSGTEVNGDPQDHGEAYDFAQNVNLSLKRYLDAEDMKVQVSEHTKEDMKALYESKKAK